MALVRLLSSALNVERPVICQDFALRVVVVVEEEVGVEEEEEGVAAVEVMGALNVENQVTSQENVPRVEVVEGVEVEEEEEGVDEEEADFSEDFPGKFTPFLYMANLLVAFTEEVDK